jgi:ketosteroid isomerase-like protein
MSDENVEVVRRAYDEVNTRLEPSEEMFHPDYEVDATDTGADVGIVRGAGAAREAFLEYWETFENFHVDIQEVIHADRERVVTLVRDGGRMKGSNAEVWNRFFHVWTFAGGRVIRLSIHTDRTRALEAAGLREEAMSEENVGFENRVRRE